MWTRKNNAGKGAIINNKTVAPLDGRATVLLLRIMRVPLAAVEYGYRDKNQTGED